MSWVPLRGGRRVRRWEIGILLKNAWGEIIALSSTGSLQRSEWKQGQGGRVTILILLIRICSPDIHALDKGCSVGGLEERENCSHLFKDHVVRRGDVW